MTAEEQPEISATITESTIPSSTELALPIQEESIKENVSDIGSPPLKSTTVVPPASESESNSEFVSESQVDEKITQKEEQSDSEPTLITPPAIPDSDKTTEVVFKPDGTVDTSRMLPAPFPEIKYEENIPGAIPNHQKQYLIKSIKSVKRLKDAFPFLTPVDTVKLQIPFYYNFITQPMDLSTIERKLNVNSYRSPEAVHEDFNTMVNNCVKFNGDKSSISRMALNIQASFEKLLLNVPARELPVGNGQGSADRKRKPNGQGPGNGVPKIRRDNTSGRPKREIHPPKPKDMPYDIRPRNKKLLADLRFAGQILKELTSKKHETINYPFLEPVDPVALDCPTYFDIVKQPMDFSTIQGKLQNNQYNSLEEFHSDVKLVFHNCYLFNPEGSPVNVMGHRLEGIFDKRYLDRPIHDATPPPGEDYDDDDEYDDFDEDEEMEIENSIMNNQAIQFLEAQIERMKKDLEKMKKEEYEKAKKRAMKSKKKKGLAKNKKLANANRKRKFGKSNGIKQSSEDAIELTFDMKKELSEKISDLNEKKLQHVMKIINESVPDLQKDGEDEIELDMDMLDDETLLKLYNFVVAKNKKLKSKNGTINGSNKRTSGNKKDTDQAIDILKQRIEEYDNRNTAMSSDEDDDDDESESSEEE